MSRSVTLPLTRDKYGDGNVPADRFPAKCVVCLASATKEYMLMKVFSRYRGATIAVKAYIPMCDEHFAKASFKKPAEKLLGGVGALVVAVIIGLLTGIMLIQFVEPGPDRNQLVGFVAFSTAVLASGIMFFLSPFFADPASKQVRNAVKITSYDFGNHTVRLDFEQDQIANSLQ